MKNLSNFLRLAVLVIVTGITINGHAQTNYYSKSTGNLNLTASWGTNTNGTGTAPANFTATNQVFNIVNNATPTIAANWTVSGTGSYIVVGNGTNACNFQIPSNNTCTGTINVSANATLTIANTTIPALGTLNASSTVVFDGTNNQTIPAVTYGNLTYSGSATGIMAAGGCTISGLLSVTNGYLVLDNSNNNSYTYNVGSFTVNTPGYVDFGSGNGTGTSTMNLSGNLIQTNGYIYTSGNTPNGIINFSGTNQNAQQSASYYMTYVILSGSIVTLTGNFTSNGQDGIYAGVFTVNSGGTLNCGTYDLLTQTDANATAFTLSGGGTLMTGNTAGIASSGTTGSIQIASTFSSAANYTYNGTAAQGTGIFTTTPTANTVNNLTINNASGVTLSQPEAVAGALTLTDGLLNTSLLTMVTVNNGGTTSGASNSSFVNGPITKIGNQAFTFPVGASGTGYVPIGISAPSTTTDAFLAQYNRSSAILLGLVTAIGLDHVSGCDYWTLNHTAGSSSVNVTGYWNANSPCGGTYVNNLATIAVAHFNGTNWNAWGNNGGVTGSTASGSVTWNSVSTFSPFALSSTTISDPLPLTLVDFNAQWQTGGTVGLTWEVQDGLNTNHFDIQRSADGVNWETIGTLDASGSSALATNYSYTDAAPLPARDYYRLQLVDNAGYNTFSAVKVVSQSTGTGIAIFPNPATDRINISLGASGQAGSAGASGVSGPVSIRLMNVTGQILLQESVAQPAGQTITLPVAGYPAGSYLVQVLAAGEVKQSSIVLIIK